MGAAFKGVRRTLWTATPGSAVKQVAFWDTNPPVGGSSCPLRTPFKRRGDLSGTHLPRCSQRSPAFLRGDAGGGVERGRGRREKTLILRSRPPPTSGAPPRLGVHTTAGQGARVGHRPGRARGSQYLPAPPGFAAPPPGHRPQTRAGRLRGGASGFKSGRRWALAVERAEALRTRRRASRWDLGSWSAPEGNRNTCAAFG